MKKYILAICVIMFGLSLRASQPDSLRKPLMLTDVISNPKFYPQTVENIRSMADGEYFTTLENNSVVRTDYATGRQIDTLFSPEMITDKALGNISDYCFDASESMLLLTTQQKAIYRRSFTAQYFVFDLKTKKLMPVSNRQGQMQATFSPIGNRVAYVWQNNLYIAEPEYASEVQVTKDGCPNQIINGIPDWVYEEEFETNRAYEWSPDGRYLAWIRFDESRVKTFSIDKYDSVYPSHYTYKYPKAGEANSVVSIWVYDTQSGQSRCMNTGNDSSSYIPRIRWAGRSGQLAILRLNRHQNHIDVLLADASSGTSSVLYSETDSKFISCISDQFITFLPDGFVVMSGRSGYLHFYRYSKDGRLKNQITKGNFDVGELLGIDTTSQALYYTSTETSPLNRCIYRINLNGKDKQLLSSDEGTSSAAFSRNFAYYIGVWCNANTPHCITVNKIDGKVIRTLEDNSFLRDRMKEYAFVPKDFFTLNTDDGSKLYGYMLKPSDFDPAKKYPVLMIVYGGPQSQYATNDWDYRMGWMQLMSQQGYIVACVDNRGTDGRGEEFRKSTYLQLGKLETADQLTAAHYLGSLSYVDSCRIGIFGWSYGGTMAALCMMKGNGFFKMGIAVAPVTDWRFYDTVYAERYMQTPRENEDGYNSNGPLSEASELKGKFLLIHGSADDNVHLQNSMSLASKLVRLNIPFDFFVYPDKNHHINGGKSRLHVYGKITDYILKNL
jgi:dipeptidyl-peptidase-4